MSQSVLVDRLCLFTKNKKSFSNREEVCYRKVSGQVHEVQGSWAMYTHLQRIRLFHLTSHTSDLSLKHTRSLSCTFLFFSPNINRGFFSPLSLKLKQTQQISWENNDAFKSLHVHPNLHQSSLLTDTQHWLKAQLTLTIANIFLINQVPFRL